MSNGFNIRNINGESRRPRRRSEGNVRAFLLWCMSVPAKLFRYLHRRKRELGWKKFILRGVLIAFGLGVLYIGFLWLTLPSIDEQTILSASQSTVITDRNGIELYRVFGEQDRTVIPASAMSDHMKHAIIAIEDQRFFERSCIDFRALSRALISFGRLGGASTITRQLARNALNLQHENVVSRKIKELILGCQLESRYTKERLLELYLNWIPFGQNAYGIEQAAREYFGKSAKDLSIAESAALASLPQGPSYFSPYGRHLRTTISESARAKIVAGTITSTSQLSDSDVIVGLLGITVGSGSSALNIGGRADQVLENMQAQGYITEEEKTKATSELKKLTFKPARENIRAPHFVLWAKDQVETILSATSEKELLEQGGITIQTTLDWRLQEAAEQVIAAHKDDVEKRFMASNIALVAVDPATRQILAYVGNTDYGSSTKEGKIDMAQAPRQPGSSFKPFVYSAAFRAGFSPATVLYDVPTKFGDYQPQNFEGGFWGLLSARRALGGSRNIPAVKAYFLGGEESTILDLAEQMGVVTPKKLQSEKGYGAPLAIGSAEVPLIEMVQGYATLADGGQFVPMTGILKVTDSHGSIIESLDENPASGKQVLDPRIAYEVTSILSDLSARPNEFWKSVLSVPGTEAAAKTGTSNKCLEWDEKKINCKKRKPSDVWTMGYTPVLATGVWAGNATSDPLSEKADGLTVAAPIWRDFMAKAQKILKPSVTAFTVPDGIVQAQVSLLSGELPSECTPVALRSSDVFLAENVPTKEDPGCVRLMVDKLTGLLASDSCPVEAREERSFLVPYNAAGADFPQWDTQVAQWATAQAMENPRAGSGLTLFMAGSGGVLPMPLAPTKKCDISMTPGRMVKPTLVIVSPAENGTANYPSFVPKLQYTVGSRVQSVAYELDGKPLATATGFNFTPPLRVPASVSKSGTHHLRVTLTDEYFNQVTAEATITFSMDRSGPSVRLLSPESGTTVKAGDPIMMRAQADDSSGDIKFVEFYIDAQLIVRKPIAPYELSYPANLTPGQHTVKAVATDLSGNTSEDEVTITVQ